MFYIQSTVKGHIREKQNVFQPQVGLSSQQTWWGHWLNSFWNTQTLIFMIMICVTLNEGQVQYNWHVMHSHVWGSHRAEFDDDDFNSFRGIACDGHAHTHTHTHTHMHTHMHAHTHTQTQSQFFLKQNPHKYTPWAGSKPPTAPASSSASACGAVVPVFPAGGTSGSILQWPEETKYFCCNEEEKKQHQSSTSVRQLINQVFIQLINHQHGSLHYIYFPWLVD